MKAVWRTIGLLVGPRHVRRIAMTLFVVLTLIGMTLLIAGQAPPLMDWSTDMEGGTVITVPEDTDGDGLPDALENLIGSDPHRFDTLEQNVPDGWIYHWFGAGVDWNDTSLLDQLALAPPLGELPGPLQRPGSIPLPTVAELFHLEDERMRDEKGLSGAWWLVEPGLDPLHWDNAHDGVADAWFLMHDLHPMSTDVDAAAPGDPEMTGREKYEHGLDPHTRDSSGNGLLDVEAITGAATIAGTTHDFDPLDPTRFSSRGDTIADGYLVRFGLDPHDKEIASRTPAGDGVSVQDAYDATWRHCETDAGKDDDATEVDTAECPWRERLEEGPLVDPTLWDSIGDGVPDAWSLSDPHGIADPLVNATTVLRYTTQEWDATPWTGDPDRLEGVLIDNHNPQPSDPHEVTLFDLYRYQRPSDWDEQSMGPWWGGLPTVVETPEGGLPPAVALRGWTIEVDLGLGGTSDVRMSNASSDPRRADTSGDGLTDLEEYYGITNIDGETIEFGRTNPSDPDTDGDGLTDHDEVAVYGTDPTRQDTSGSFLSDGAEAVYWNERHESERDAFLQATQTDPEEAQRRWDWLLDEGESEVTVGHFDKLLPSGSIHGGTSNILSASTSGDGLKDGQELQPNRFPPLNLITSHVRPETDPARVDTSGDRLPDEWKIQWSMDSVFDCRGPCVPPVGGISGWPLNPAMNLSVPDPSAATDRDVNLAGDFVQTPDGILQFNNWIAFQYDLSPYHRDTSGDGIPNMFSLHWGVENVPIAVIEKLREDRELEDERDRAEAAANRISTMLTGRGFDPLNTDFVIIDPGADDPAAALVSPESNLLGMFDGREKGTWVYVPPGKNGTWDDIPCDRTSLPGDGNRREAGYQNDWNGAQHIADRVGPQATVDLSATERCWEWIDYPLDRDIDTSDPWRHDFRDKGVPDVWRQHYGMPSDSSVDDPTPGSREGGCEDPAATTGWELPDDQDSFCLSWLESYELGLDPNTNDTDGGGLPDWQEILLGLDPLDPSDDFVEEDWSGDGLPNSVKIGLGLSLFIPDTAGSGLVDGDLKALFQEDDMVPRYDHLDADKGNGDLCLRRGGDTVPSMENRPAAPPTFEEGPLTWTQLFDWYVELGILHFPATGDTCSGLGESPEGEPWFVFLREGAWDPSQELFRGAGGGTDPHTWDTSGDSLPDAWLVYWREQARQAGMPTQVIGGLNPHEDVSGEILDDDFLTNLEEYRRNRPDDWDEGRDGIWWGGSSPIHEDTGGGAEEWFEIPMDARDLRNPDLDYDGIPDWYDPFPGIDTKNQGVVKWSEGDCPRPGQDSCYVTDYTKLWEAIEQRRDTHLSDRDGDRVPDFLDRARIRIVDPVVEQEEDDLPRLVQGGDPVKITGRVALDEPEPLPDWPDPRIGDDPVAPGEWASGEGWSVANLTVKAYADDGQHRSLVGFAFTDEYGNFELNAAATASISGPDTPPNGAALEGTFFAGGSTITLEGEGHRLVPGPATLHLEVEANDPELQPIHFTHEVGGETARIAGAHKVAPFPIPGRVVEVEGDTRNVRVEALLINEDGTGADANVDEIHHGTNAVFETRIDPQDIVLASVTHLRPDTVSPVLTGGTVEVTGRLVNEAGTGLPERNVRAEFTSEEGQGIAHENTTDGQGAFHLELPTDNLPPAIHGIRLHIVDWADEGLLVPPEEEALSVLVTREALWEALQIDGTSFQAGEQLATDAAQAMELEARLVDHDGKGLAGQQTTFVLFSPRDDASVLQQTAVTDNDGHVTITVPPVPPGTSAGSLTATLHAPETSTQAHEPATWFLLPRFHVELKINGTTVPVGQTGQLEGKLLRANGPPIHDPDAAFVARSDQGENVTVTGTDPEGVFQIPVGSDNPEKITWTVRYMGSSTYHPSEEKTGTSVHTSTTRIVDIVGEGLRHEPVEVEGALRLADGRPASGTHAVEILWDEADPEDPEAWTVRGGSFQGALPARTSAGSHELIVRFSGTETLHASQARAQVEVLAPTRLEVETDNLTLPPEREGEPTFFTARLLEEAPELGDRPLGGRTLQFIFEGPDGENFERDASTDAEGQVHLRALETGLQTPGEWTVKATYERTDFEAGSQNETHVLLRHAARVELDRVPASLNPGTDARIVGHIQAPGNATGPFEVTVILAGQIITTEPVSNDGHFSFRFPVPGLPRGETTLEVIGQAGEHVDVEAASMDVMILAPVAVRLEEQTLEDNTRRIHVMVDAPPEARWEGGEIVIARHRADGTTASTYRVAVDGSGHGSVDLDARETGDVSVLAVLADGLRIKDSALLVATAPEAPVGAAFPWQWIAGAIALVVVALLGASYAWWRHRQAEALRRSWENAIAALHDPGKSPAAVVREAYQQLLDALGRTGYDTSHRTVRDVTDEATRLFRLPPAPMQVLSHLFERVAYARAELFPTDRREAILAFETLYTQIPDPLRPKRVQRSPPNFARSPTHA